MTTATVKAGLEGLQAAVLAAGSLERAPTAQVVDLVRRGDAILIDIDLSLVDLDARLDGAVLAVTNDADSTIAALADLQGVLDDEAALFDVRGLVGRAVLNLAKGLA